ncbi:GIY-YIG nuclease family protein [Cytobacillus firmus]|uniref:LuxR family transcriptional regulator n=1 Tax=Cytobacillus firmus TaxID=1399 RepID=A0A380XSB3_CYTFI|nr:GIY-YIG nuclease family protein [Cytobacillus firmus]KAF0822555.1 LuxR family transcriptional regulator [Cytobacillus firmus]MBG9544001.1 LuxR family transcriptional regulator [Cytobacillus firmus]MBG9548175.1 LuxR family transcriptional regulator [Cytobacillus firmus]MBG9552397.1 LuxR family transcriptional regulator [Cytobacillus firmus]MBG9577402.1 LuxR family transcriptional regulator [Cytobacillus firmus]
MERKRELKQQFKETPIEAGVYQIKNNVNNKIFIGCTNNLKSLNGVRFSLETNGYMPNRELQDEWNQYGKEAFEFVILEKLKKKNDPYFNEKEALEKMEEKWLVELQPYGEKGFNKKK